MTDKTKSTKLKVKADGTVSDGKRGYFKKGDTFEPGKGSDPEGLKERGLVE